MSKDFMKGKTVKESMLIGSMLVINFTDGTGIKVLPKVDNNLNPGLDITNLPSKIVVDYSQFFGGTKK